MTQKNNVLTLAWATFLLFTWPMTALGQDGPKEAGYAPLDPDLQIGFQVIGEDPPAGRHLDCRRMLVGPWHNQPEPYPGYNGFVGWSGTTRLKSGRWLVTFSSGFWHASFPWTDEYRKNPECRKWVDRYHEIGCPDIPAPRGGRAHVMVSDDQGKTWSQPQTLIDTENDDRHAIIRELDDGTLLCTFFDYRIPPEVRKKYMRSTDGGKTWHGPADHVGYAVDPDCYGYSYPMLLPDGTIYITYQHSIGYTAEEARTEAIWGMRLRVKDNAQGIDLLGILDHSAKSPP